MKSKITNKLEKSVNILLLLSCLAVLIHLYKVHITNNQLKIPEVAQGDILLNFQSIISNPNEKNLIIYLSDDCTYCENSIPFYKKILDKENSSKTEIIFAYGLKKNSLLINKILENNQSNSIRIIKIESKKWNIIYTPSLVLADKKGRVINYWKGQLNQESEDDLLESL